ncbi:MAG: 30S ribosomal protein S15 [Methanosarcinales archaeon]|nr:30S ribosomal protein S15 [Methanosarcinales archaeon]
MEKKVVELAGQDNSTSEIGTIMRDTFGVPDVKLSTGKKVNKILKENSVAPDLPEDFTNLVTKALRLRKHLVKNHKDNHNKRALNLTESKIRRLGKYYRRKKILPVDWKYDPLTVERLITS